MKHLIRIWGNIGDAICAEPFIREFIVRHSNDHIAVQSQTPALYQHYPGVDEVHHLDDAVNRKHCHRYWFAKPDWTSHISNYFGKYGYKIEHMPPRFQLPPVDLGYFSIDFVSRPVVCIAVSPSNGIREWPFDRWERLCDALNQKYTLIQLGQNERPLKAVQHCLVNKTSLLESAEILRRSRLLVSIDSGLAHLATAMGRRNIVLFGPVNPELRVYKGYTIPVTANKCTACWPAYKGIKKCPKQHNNCMDIPVQAVLEIMYE